MFLGVEGGVKHASCLRAGRLQHYDGSGLNGIGAWGMLLSTQQQMLIEQRVTNEAKSTGAAYLLWFFLGTLGAHRFYLGSIGSAVLQLLMFIIGWATLAIGVGAFILIALGVWVLIDAFLVPGMIQSHKEKVRRNLTANAMLRIGSANPVFYKMAGERQ